MIKEDKELLVKDLCSRLPYGVKCQYTCVVQEGTLVTEKSNWIGELKGIVPLSDGHIGFMVDCDKIDALEGDIKPYLRPMLSITKDELADFMTTWEALKHQPDTTVLTQESYDWLNAHHFDYRGLIEKGLAIEAPEGMYN